jgi:hydroxyquinol 1,2-dioxygenase
MTTDFTEETATAVVFAVKKSLIVDFAKTDEPALAHQWGVPVSFRHADIEIVVQPIF